MGFFDGKFFVPVNVHLDDDPKIIRAGEKAQMLYEWGLRFAKKAAMDGFIDAAQLRRFPYAGVKARTAALVREGLWLETEGGYIVAAWGKWNEPAAKSMERSLRAHDAGVLGNHRRHHTNGRRSDECPYCTGVAVDSGSNEPPDEDPDDDPTRVPDRQPDSGTRSGPRSQAEQSRARAERNTLASDSAEPSRGRELGGALAEACGMDTSRLTTAERRRLDAAVAQLDAVDATPEQVAERGRNFRLWWPSLGAPSPSAIASNWTKLAAAPSTSEPVPIERMTVAPEDSRIRRLYAR